ncbi:RNA-protein complex protein Nop10 [Methanomethylophilus alvi]|uniref:RNA-protein complex protein Nop10 n=1 Tax=Methanomethylophilus alvi TaxID=1291540 RepID=UPI0037DD2F8C
MRSQIRRCPQCGRYTLSEVCGRCTSPTVCPIPPRFSPEDRYGKYRRKTLKQEYGENGKYRKV